MPWAGGLEAIGAGAIGSGAQRCGSLDGPGSLVVLRADLLLLLRGDARLELFPAMVLLRLMFTEVAKDVPPGYLGVHRSKMAAVAIVAVAVVMMIPHCPIPYKGSRQRQGWTPPRRLVILEGPETSAEAGGD